MKMNEQAIINDEVIQHFECAYEEMQYGKTHSIKRLRSCEAYVYETGHFYLLKSYNTFVACIDKESNTLYDALRYTYGYTATSAQHVFKFAKDYFDTCKPADMARYYPV